jgi:hypothetical protein
VWPDHTVGPSYQVPFAQAVKEATGVNTIAVGLITDAQQAEEIIASGKADLVALARGMLYEPRWSATPRRPACVDVGPATCVPATPPRFVELAPELRKHGVDNIICLSVNDPFVMDTWQREHNAGDFTFLPDADGTFTAGMGMLSGWGPERDQRTCPVR